MDNDRLGLLIQTVRHLKAVQFYYRLYYKIRGLWYHLPVKESTVVNTLSLASEFPIYSCFSHEHRNSFYFLNQKVTFKDSIDWNYPKNGKLWCYNLNYFEFLHQHNFEVEEGIKLIKEYIDFESKLKDGLEPYPISLRIINWIKFLLKNQINHLEIDSSLKWYADILRENLEYHLLGNHLLENGFALLFSGCYFQNAKFLKIANDILSKELEKQILEDGAHFEQSPMYHQIILYRLLDSINLLQSSAWNQPQDFSYLKLYSSKMLSWLSQITFKNGEIPYVNDSAPGIAPSTKTLLNYASSLGMDKVAKIQMSQSGYRKIISDKFEVLFDIGNITATYQAGHHHSDALQLLLNHDNQPILVDTGVSTYEKNQRRNIERSTSSHNTIMFTSYNNDNVWGGFRTAQRSKVNILKDDEFSKKARLTHYKTKVRLTRSVDLLTNTIIVKDEIDHVNTAKAYFHFHPDCKLEKIENNVVRINPNCITFEFVGKNMELSIEDYKFAAGYNALVLAQRIKVSFVEELKTIIN